MRAASDGSIRLRSRSKPIARAAIRPARELELARVGAELQDHRHVDSSPLSSDGYRFSDPRRW